MALTPKRASRAIPIGANFLALLAALGNAARNIRYDNGVLHVSGVTNAELEAAAASVDLIHADRVSIKQTAAAELKARVEAGMPWSGHTLQIDEESAARITSGAVAASLDALPEGFAWRMKDNVALPMDEAGMIAMATAAFTYIFALRTRYWQIVDAVDAAADATALAAINPATGWPSPPSP